MNNKLKGFKLKGFRNGFTLRNANIIILFWALLIKHKGYEIQQTVMSYAKIQYMSYAKIQ